LLAQNKEKSLFALIKFVLGNAHKNNEQIKNIIQSANEQDIDVLRYISFEYKISPIKLYSKAAKYCNLAFSEVVPRDIKINLDIIHVEELKSINGFKASLFDREILFVTPNIDDLFILSNEFKNNPKSYICIVPPNALQEALVANFSSDLIDEARQRLARRWRFASAHLDLTYPSRILFLIGFISLIALVTLTPLALTIYILPLLILLFLVPAWLRLAAVFEPPPKPFIKTLLGDDDLPIYSVLIPLRDEAQMVSQLARAMQNLDYPPYKLDIKFIVESASKKTVLAVREILDDPRFELIIVPKASPHTKPKALDFALPFVRGKHLVIYDAEDIPEPSQLRKSATRFAYDYAIDCIQAELVIENDKESWLTNLFCAEYSALFGIMLPALAKWKFPMPLGGTSNHFRTSSLLEVGGWDAFNVTEDADLGLRLSRLRYKVGILNSKTYEEAPATLFAWINQRTRWMKGWMQTFIVHNRHPIVFFKDAGWRNFLAFQIYVGSLIISPALHTIFLMVFIFRFVSAGKIDLQTEEAWLFIYLFFLVVGYLATTLHSIIGMIRLKKFKALFLIPTLPFYWALSGIASFIAAYELIVKPYFWSKTKHGLTNVKRRQK